MSWQLVEQRLIALPDLVLARNTDRRGLLQPGLLASTIKFLRN